MLLAVVQFQSFNAMSNSRFILRKAFSLHSTQARRVTRETFSFLVYLPTCITRIACVPEQAFSRANFFPFHRIRLSHLPPTAVCFHPPSKYLLPSPLLNTSRQIFVFPAIFQAANKFLLLRTSSGDQREKCVHVNVLLQFSPQHFRYAKGEREKLRCRHVVGVCRFPIFFRHDSDVVGGNAQKARNTLFDNARFVCMNKVVISIGQN